MPNEFKIKNGLVVEQGPSQITGSLLISGSLVTTQGITGSLFGTASFATSASYADVSASLGFTPENVANKSTSTTLGTSDSLYPTQNAVKVYADTKVDKVTTSGVERAYIINADGSQGTKALADFDKNATFTIELIDLQTVDFYAPDDLRINTITNVKGTPTTTLKVNDVAYTLGALITQGAKITVEVNIASVINLNVRYE